MCIRVPGQGRRHQDQPHANLTEGEGLLLWKEVVTPEEKREQPRFSLATSIGLPAAAGQRTEGHGSCPCLPCVWLVLLTVGTKLDSTGNGREGLSSETGELGRSVWQCTEQLFLGLSLPPGRRSALRPRGCGRRKPGLTRRWPLLQLCWQLIYLQPQSPP